MDQMDMDDIASFWDWKLEDIGQKVVARTITLAQYHTDINAVHEVSKCTEIPLQFKSDLSRFMELTIAQRNFRGHPLPSPSCMEAYIRNKDLSRKAAILHKLTGKDINFLLHQLRLRQ
jgi:hypothetical protein